MTLIDQAGAVRSGEELDVAAVDAFLKGVDHNLEGVPTVSQFPGGASNLTYLLSYANRELILRRPPFGAKAKSAHDMLREANIMTELKPVYPYVPSVFATCQDRAVMDSDFYVMERLRGIVLRDKLPEGLALSEAETRQLCLNVIDKMIALHQVDYQAAGLAHLGKGDGYVQRQISGWSERYRKARTDNAVDFEEVMRWLADKMPAGDVATCLIHNDFRFDNVVLNPDDPLQVIGVLDWEMATLGDPLMDLGNALAYWVQADDEPQFKQMRRQPTHLPGMLTRKEVVAYYAEKTGYRTDHFDFYEIYGLFRLAVIVQQIYYRFHHGQTKNPQFSFFVHVTNYLEQRCKNLIAQSTLLNT
ncbi:phosphotransferase enzyme family protein [Collimonas arenae]|uniref:Phosphotransferase enzyme family protein n=1 Tax=Collimonas arenae TaxID=279058 RepID=A0A127PV30_9BURK|nr:phosphotransferase family protein [Collimonas arenae]AMP01671.1 phosphotransferase enzyme family protein [Collimonas arenae]AMP11567.1 phosphotransferase enzyme family protein [Collimonas arenae]